MRFFEPFTVTEKRLFLGCIVAFVMFIGYGVGTYTRTNSAQRFIPTRPNSDYARDRHIALDTRTGQECWTGADESRLAGTQTSGIPDYTRQFVQPHDPFDDPNLIDRAPRAYDSIPSANAGLPLCKEL